MLNIENNKLKGILIYSIPMFMFPIIDTAIQYLVRLYPVTQVAGVRFTFQALFLTIVFLLFKKNLKNTFTTNLKPKLIISTLSISLTMGFFYALKTTTLSLALTSFFTAPIITAIFGALIFKEKISKLNMLSILLGFIAMILIVRPGMNDFNIGALYGLAGSFSWALILITSQHYKKSLNIFELQLFTGLYCAIGYFIIHNILFPQHNMFGITPTLFWIGLITSIAAILIIYLVHKGVRLAGASTVAPLQYMELFSGLIIDLLLYAILPDTKSWIGINLIIISGLLTWYSAKNKKNSS